MGRVECGVGGQIANGSREMLLMGDGCVCYFDCAVGFTGAYGI